MGAAKWMVYLAHRWRLPKLMWALIVIEVPLSIAALALFGIADPDTYRTRLWQNGANEGFNSDPSEILYDYANYRPVHKPLVWSGFMTQFNVVCAVLSMFILLVKSVMYVLHGFLPLLSVFVHALLVALYAVALRNQATPDTTNKDVPNLQENLPWYLSKGCGFASDKNHGYCMQASASFGLTIVMLILFIVYLGAAIYSSIITKEEKAERQADYDEDMEMKQLDKEYDPDAGLTKEEVWERNRQMFMNMPKTPSTPAHQPFTPRTTAFHKLGGSTGEPSAVGRNPMVGSSRVVSSSTRPFPLRVYDEAKKDLI